MFVMEHRFILKVMEENAKPPAGFIRSENQPKLVGSVIIIPGGGENPTDEDKFRAAICAIERFQDAGTKVKKLLTSREVIPGGLSGAKIFLQCEPITYEVILCPT